MPYFPFFTDIENIPCLIVGGGTVALRKIQKLSPFKPKITVVAPFICEDIAELPDIALCRRAFAADDLDGTAFVITAADDAQLNEEISRLCKQRRIPCNAVDNPDNCTFFFPALVTAGDVAVGISTAGKSPTLAAHIRELIEEQTGDAAELCGLLGMIRPLVKELFPTEGQRREAMKKALDFCLENEPLPDDNALKEYIFKLRNDT